MSEKESLVCSRVDLEKKEEVKKQRVWEIDFLRGICILLMVFDHLMWQIHDFIWKYFGITDWTASNIPEFLRQYHYFGTFYYTNDFRIEFRFMVLFLFFFICGISMNFSKNNTKRGLVCLICGLCITLVTIVLCMTNVIDPQGSLISFGVLSCLGSCILITHFLKKLVYKMFNNNFNAWVITVCILSWILILLGKYFRVHFPSYELVRNDPMSYFVGILGNIFGFANFGGDYFPLVPYLAYTLLGNMLGEVFYKNKTSLFKKEPKVCKPFTVVGRNTMWIYLLHIPVITLIHVLLFIACGFRVKF